MKGVLYNVYKDGLCIGDYTAAELHKKLGINLKTLYGYVGTGIVYRKHYTFQRSYSRPAEKLTKEELLAEWDRWRKIVNPEAVDYVRN